MITAILLDNQTNVLNVVKTVNSGLFVDVAFSNSFGSVTIPVGSLKKASKMLDVSFIFVTGPHLNKLFYVLDVKLNNTSSFIEVSYNLESIEKLFNRRVFLAQATFNNINPITLCKNLIETVQNDAIRKFPQIINTVKIDTSADIITNIQFLDDTVWDIIEGMMKQYKFQVQTIYNSFGVYQLYFRVGVEYKNIIFADADKKSNLNYIYSDNSEIITFVTNTGKGEAPNQYRANYDFGSVGFDRYEKYNHSNATWDPAVITEQQYWNSLYEDAKSQIKQKEIDTDFWINNKYFDLVNVGDVIMISTKAYKSGKLLQRRIFEKKTSINQGVISRSITLEEV